MHRRQFLSSAGAAAWLAACADPGGLERYREPIATLLNQQIEGSAMPGAVWLLAEGDVLSAGAIGRKGPDDRAPMTRDTIFRIASMTKPITAATVMMLVEEGKLSLDDPAERYLPELANRRVLRTLQSQLDDTVAAARPISVRELMNFTFGFGVSFDASLPIMQAARDLQLVIAEPTPMTPHDPDAWMAQFSTLPLMAQPGSTWFYNVGSLIQGVLVRRVSGQPLEAFVAERITEPLGMHDTGFHVPAAKLDRFAGCGYYTDPESGERVRMDGDGADSAYATTPVFASGAAGLCSTADDFLAFARMLMREGEHNGRRILSAASVQAMRADQLTAAQRAASAQSYFPGYFDNSSWGYGVGVQTGPTRFSSAGGYGWDGGFGTSWFSDPTRRRISIILTQSTDFLFNGSLERYRGVAEI